jgi:hypothetical protein
VTRSGPVGLPDGALVLHQHRDELGNSVIDRYTLVRIRDGSAELARPGSRRLTRVAVDTILSSPAWAVQGALW